MNIKTVKEYLKHGKINDIIVKLAEEQNKILFANTNNKLNQYDYLFNVIGVNKASQLRLKSYFYGFDFSTDIDKRYNLAQNIKDKIYVAAGVSGILLDIVSCDFIINFESIYDNEANTSYQKKYFTDKDIATHEFVGGFNSDYRLSKTYTIGENCITVSFSWSDSEGDAYGFKLNVECRNLSKVNKQAFNDAKFKIKALQERLTLTNQECEKMVDIASCLNVQIDILEAENNRLNSELDIHKTKQNKDIETSAKPTNNSRSCVNDIRVLIDYLNALDAAGVDNWEGSEYIGEYLDMNDDEVYVFLNNVAEIQKKY